jgi:hypothetical protein
VDDCLRVGRVNVFLLRFEMHFNFKLHFRAFLKDVNSVSNVAVLSEYAFHVIRHRMSMSTRLQRSQISMSHCEL